MKLLKWLFGRAASSGYPIPNEVLPKESSDGPASAFVRECFSYPFKPVPDKRTASDFAEVDDIDRLVQAQDFTSALALVDRCLAKHPDFYVFHGRRAHIYSLMRDTEKEKAAHSDALERSLRKYYACDSLAQLAFDSGNDRDAVLWWVRACDLQLQVREMRYPRCFICLAYVAVGLGDAESERWLRECADQTPMCIDLNAEAANSHYQLGMRAGATGLAEPFRSAIRQLRKRSPL